jgi:nascent polypeptide-associated complex subunit alpha
MIPGGMNPKNMKKLMKKMGIKSEEIDAVQVIISCVDKQIIIDEPSVIRTLVQGQEMFQVQGTVRQEESDDQVQISQDDVELVAAQSGVGHERALQALEAAGGDIAQAIIDLKS